MRRQSLDGPKTGTNRTRQSRPRTYGYREAALCRKTCRATGSPRRRSHRGHSQRPPRRKHVVDRVQHEPLVDEGTVDSVLLVGVVERSEERGRGHDDAVPVRHGGPDSGRALSTEIPGEKNHLADCQHLGTRPHVTTQDVRGPVTPTHGHRPRTTSPPPSDNVRPTVSRPRRRGARRQPGGDRPSCVSCPYPRRHPTRRTCYRR